MVKNNMKENQEDITRKRELIAKISEGERRAKSKKRNKRIAILFLSVCLFGVIIYLVNYNLNLYQEKVSSPQYTNPHNLTIEDFDCLAMNYKFYGSPTCSHCNNQKAYFGSEIVDFAYIDCSENSELCSKMGIEGVPYHYAINKNTQNVTILMGEQTIDAIFDATQCRTIVAKIDITK
jgi:glutaredoxin